MAFPDVMLGPEPPVKGYMIYGHTETGYWFDALGWVAYFFAQVEWAAYVVVEKLEAPADRLRSSKLLFKARCQRADVLMAAHVKDAQLADEWSEFWADAIAAAPMRNKILHNPFTLGLDGRDVATEHDGIKLIQDAGQPVLKLGRVQTYNEQLSALVRRMHELFSRTQLPL
ncbi:hypothetical protein [Mitsuaria sp. GD03876]|uniref:hypothetical protein n=1 Tax=Mitsuaria sp. GD03876 TaxID=2975399 RepID=UPI00244923AF|nr:hypothetical protein [Mitsuaria sp. GD03876]MDH0866481.1 hypothetical protein [Mitsuaria sp. GD03876]